MENRYFVYEPMNLVGKFDNEETFAKYIIDNYKDKINSVIKTKAWMDWYCDYSKPDTPLSLTYYPYLVKEVCKLIKPINKEEVKKLKEIEY